MFQDLNIKPEEYFLTGSRALDTETDKVSEDNSDHDYVVLITNRHIIESYLSSISISVEHSCYNGGFKFLYKEKYYNIITAVECEFMAWKEALYILKYLISTQDIRYKKAIKNKMSRYCLYEQLRAFVKTFLRLGEL